MIKLIAQEPWLAYPNFQEPFDVYTDGASEGQLGACEAKEASPLHSILEN